MSVSFCTGQPGCICIDWDRGTSSYLEVRCTTGGGTGGWTQDPTGETVDHPGGGGWNGPGDEKQSDNPGTPLTMHLLRAWNIATDQAWCKGSRSARTLGEEQ